MQENEIERRVILSDSECLWRTVHSEQANEGVRFVSGVELQHRGGGKRIQYKRLVTGEK